MNGAEMPPAVVPVGEAAAGPAHAADPSNPADPLDARSKTLEAIGWELAHGRRAELDSFAAQVTALLEEAQRPDGYLNSYFQVSGEPRYTRMAWSHEMYCAGHLIQAAVALRRGAGDGRLLAVAVRLSDHLVREFAGQDRGLDGHPVIETALAGLYRETGTAAYLELARQFVDQRGQGLAGDSGMGPRYLQDHLPVRASVTEVGHVVRALYLEAGVTDVATELGDRPLLDSSVRRWDDMVTATTYLTGGNGSRHAIEGFGDRFELPPDRAYNETCAGIASFHWSWRLLLATGDAKYADHMERVLYNGFGAAIATGGQRFFYVNPMQRREDHVEKDDPGRRRVWFKCACCPPNIMRLIASLEHYLATESGDTALDLSGPPRGRGARLRGDRARPARLLLRAGRPARRRSPGRPGRPAGRSPRRAARHPGRRRPDDRGHRAGPAPGLRTRRDRDAGPPGHGHRDPVFPVGQPRRRADARLDTPG